MSNEIENYILQGSNLRWHLSSLPDRGIVGTFEKEGDVYAITPDMTVLCRHRILNIRSGKWGHLWLNAGQRKFYLEEFYHSLGRSAPMNGDPRLLALPKTGISFPDRETLLRANESPHCTASLIRDKAGHLWRCNYDMTGLSAFRTNTRHDSEGYLKEPELCFVYPWLEYFGHEDDEAFWVNNRDGKQVGRYTVGNYEVQKVIEKMGMWGHYFPSKKEWEDVKRATKACEKAKKNLMSTKIAHYDEALKIMETRNKDLTTRNHQLESELTQARGRITELEEGLPKQLAGEIALAQLRAAEAERRAEKAEATLAAARAENEGWDWSRF